MTLVVDDFGCLSRQVEDWCNYLFFIEILST